MAKEKQKEIKEDSVVYHAFGIDTETLNKAKDIRPILQLGKNMAYNIAHKVMFQEKLPREIDTPNSPYKDKSRVINVVDLDTQLEYSLFVSSRTLAMGISRIWKAHNEDLTDIKVRIIKSRVIFKEFGENDCYNVQEIKDI